MNRHPVLEKLARDAAALVRAASPHDWPGGFVVVDERLPGTIRGAAVGTGYALAAMYRHRPGVRAVLLDLRRFVADPDEPNVRGLADLERAACHEAAHALVATGDTTPDVVASLLQDAGAAVPAYDATAVARMHGPRWAAAYWLLADRGATFRRGWRASLLREIAGRDLALYGFSAADVARVTRGADPDVPVGQVLAAGGPGATLVATVLPDERTRVAAIVAAGMAREPQSTGVAS